MAEKPQDEMGGMFGVVLRVSRVVGVASLSFSRDGQAKISRSFLIYSRFLVIILHGVFGYNMINLLLLQSRNKNSSPSKYYQLPALITFSFIALNTLLSLGALRGATRMKQILSYIKKIEQIRLITNKPHLFEPQQLSIPVVVVLMTGDWLISASKLYVEKLEMYSIIIARALAYTIINLMELQFMSIVKFLNATFDNINNCLEKMHQQSDVPKTQPSTYVKVTSSVLKTSVNSVNKAVDLIGTPDYSYSGSISSYKLQNALEIRQMMLAFVSTCRTVKDLNGSENIHLLLQLTISSSEILISLFILSEALDMKDNLTSKIYIMTFNSLSCMYHLTRVLFLVQPCHQMGGQLKRTQFLVSQNMSHALSKEDPTSPELEVFYQQLILNNPSYVVIDVFKLERPLISAIISGVITILLMII